MLVLKIHSFPCLTLKLCSLKGDIQINYYFIYLEIILGIINMFMNISIIFFDAWYSAWLFHRLGLLSVVLLDAISETFATLNGGHLVNCPPRQGQSRSVGAENNFRLNLTFTMLWSRALSAGKVWTLSENTSARGRSNSWINYSRG